MRRMQALRLMPSITYFHKKMDEFGIDHNKEILTKVSNEAKRRCKPKPVVATSTNVKDTVPTDIVNSVGESGKEKQDSANNWQKIQTSLAQVISNDQVDGEPPIIKKQLLVFPSQKLADTDHDHQENMVAPTNCTDCTLTVMNQADKVIDSKITPDNGRKLVLDNVDVHQLTHDMTEQHQNPDAHFCTLMATENRVSGNHLSEDGPICNLKDMENGKCCPDKLEHKLQHENYVQLVSRVIAHELPCLNFLRDVTLSHIPHEYSANMKHQTETVSNRLHFF